MKFKHFGLTALAATWLLAGCSFTSDALFPSLAGEGEGNGEAQQAAEVGGPGQPPALGTGVFKPGQISSIRATGTAVGERTQQLHGELQTLVDAVAQQNNTLQDLRSQASANAQDYHATVAGINTRLQNGTTPGNPELVEAWNNAQTQLDQIASDVARMNQLANAVAADATSANYINDAVRATLQLSGAVELDHAQLRTLQDETNQVTVLVDRLLTELSGDINRQSAYLSNERNNLTTLALAVQRGQLYGSSLANRAVSPVIGTAPGGGAQPIATNRPLVVIRFDRPNVQYEQPLYNAVNQALQRRPESRFNIVAVAPSEGNAAQVALNRSAAKNNADQVARTLASMGLPQDRIDITEQASPQADSTEVHVYVR